MDTRVTYIVTVATVAAERAGRNATQAQTSAAWTTAIRSQGGALAAALVKSHAARTEASGGRNDGVGYDAAVVGAVLAGVSLIACFLGWCCNALLNSIRGGNPSGKDGEATQGISMQEIGVTVVQRDSHLDDEAMKKNPMREIGVTTNAELSLSERGLTEAAPFKLNGEDLTGIATPHIDIQAYHALFQRYDFDNSGTINTVEEVKHLTTNLLFTLFKEQRITNNISVDGLIEAIDLGQCGLSPREYLEWFRHNVQPHLTFTNVQPHSSFTQHDSGVMDLFKMLGFEDELQAAPGLLKTLKEYGVDTANDLAELSVQELIDCGMHMKASKFHAAVAASMPQRQQHQDEPPVGSDATST